MAMPPDGLSLVELDRIEARFLPAPCAFSAAERTAIDAHFAARHAANPALWNGPVLLLAEHGFEGRRLVARFGESDYASLLWLLARESPHPRLRVAYAMGALRGADGGFVLIRMAAWTANAGRVYFAAGTPDLGDVTPDGRVDLEGSVRRELAEETGLAAGDVTLVPGWAALHDGRRVALLREVQAREEAAALAARIRRFAAADPRSEIAEVLVVRGPQDLPAGTAREGLSPLVRSYLARAWEQGWGQATMTP